MFGEPVASTPRPKRRTPSATVTFDVRWCHRRTRYQLRKLTDQQFAEYQRENDAAQKWVGTHVRHFDRPFSHWTADDIARLVDIPNTSRADSERRSGGGERAARETIRQAAERLNGIGLLSLAIWADRFLRGEGK